MSATSHFSPDTVHCVFSAMGILTASRGTERKRNHQGLNHESRGRSHRPVHWVSEYSRSTIEVYAGIIALCVECLCTSEYMSRVTRRHLGM